MTAHSILTFNRTSRNILYNAIHKLVEQQYGVRFPQLIGDRLGQFSSVPRITGTTPYTLFSGQVKALIDAELASPSGALRSGLSTSEQSILSTYYSQYFADGNGTGNYEHALPFPINTDPLNLVLVVGHSIAALRHAIAGYSPVLQSVQPNTLGAWSTNSGSVAAESIGWDRIGPYEGSDGTMLGSSTLALAHYLKTQWTHVGAINVSLGGSSFAAHWQTGGTNNVMYLDMIKYIPYLLARCPVPYIVRGALIHLGENDAGNQANADAWQSRCVDLINAIRSMVGNSQLPVALAPIDPVSTLAYKATINAACGTIATLLPNIAVLDAAGWLAGAGDGVHPLPPALENVGLQAANAIIARAA